MGDFNFDQFKEIFEYLSEKLASGGALTPEEQTVYNQLLAVSNQGLNLTGTPDFMSLYQAFNALADEGTKAEFEKLYGTNFTQDPTTGAIQFTRPGSIIEQFQKRGLSVNDGPAMAALSEGLQAYLKQIAQNKFAGMTNAYSAMTPIRAQNIQAATNAGNVASTAAGRRQIAASAAGAGARGGAGEGEGEGEGVSIDTSGGEKPEKPGFMDKFGNTIIGLLGTAGIGVGGWLLNKWMKEQNQPQNFSQEELDRAASDIVGRNKFTEDLNPTAKQYDIMGSAESYDPTNINMAAWSPQLAEQNTQQPGGDQMQFNPYQGIDQNQYYGGGSQGYQTPFQQPYNYEDYSPQPYQQPYQAPATWDSGWGGVNVDNMEAYGGGYTPTDNSWTGGGDYWSGGDTYYPDPSTASWDTGWAY